MTLLSRKIVRSSTLARSMKGLVGFGHARATPAAICGWLPGRQAAVKRMLAIVPSCVAVCLYGVGLWMEKFVQDRARIGIGPCSSDETLSRLNRRRAERGVEAYYDDRAARQPAGKPLDLYFLAGTTHETTSTFSRRLNHPVLPGAVTCLCRAPHFGTGWSLHRQHARASGAWRKISRFRATQYRPQATIGLQP